jgi:hypothetical protein
VLGKYAQSSPLVTEVHEVCADKWDDQGVVSVDRNAVLFLHVINTVDGAMRLATEAAEADEARNHKTGIESGYQASDHAAEKAYDNVFGKRCHGLAPNA